MLARLFFRYLYLGKPPWDTGISPPELLEFIQTHPPGRALDLGCGTGTNVITLAKSGWKATGVDFVPGAIQKAQKKAQQAGVQVDLRVQDVSRLVGISGPFDLILDIGCLHGLPENGRQIYIENLPFLLGKEGTFLLYAFIKGTGDSGIGLTPEDVGLLSSRLNLILRKDGTDRNAKPSAWFTFQQSAGVQVKPGV